METGAYFYETEKERPFYKNFTEKSQKKIVRKQVWCHDKSPFDHFMKISHKNYKIKIVENFFICFNVWQ